MLTPIVAPTTQNLMDPETVLARLKLPESDLAELTEQVAEASGLVARYLGYQPAYGTWRETFSGVSGDRLYLGARPAWSVQGVTYRAGTAQTADSYRLERGAYGESSVVRSTGYPWMSAGTMETGWPWDASPVLPDWSIDYTAGWWLEEMAGEPPAGVERFPRELQRDFLAIVRWLRATEGSVGSLGMLGIAKTTNEGASVEFFSAVEQGIDAQTGIPASCTLSLWLYRRAT